MDKIMFGFSRFDGYRTYIRLEQLINYFTPTCQDMDELTKFAQKLSIDELSLKNVMVRTRTVGLLTYAEYMDG
jgi:NH3-dependent NAD+ synthetase